jgi:hypothetical protein
MASVEAVREDLWTIAARGAQAAAGAADDGVLTCEYVLLRQNSSCPERREPPEMWDRAIARRAVRSERELFDEMVITEPTIERPYSVQLSR